VVDVDGEYEKQIQPASVMVKLPDVTVAFAGPLVRLKRRA
jgi:hypothetical protein